MRINNIYKQTLKLFSQNMRYLVIFHQSCLTQQKYSCIIFCSASETKRESETYGSSKKYKAVQKSSTEFAVPCSLKIWQPISVGAWNECAGGARVKAGTVANEIISALLKWNSTLGEIWGNTKSFLWVATYNRYAAMHAMENTKYTEIKLKSLILAQIDR